MTAWPRTLSSEELVIVTGWNQLSKEKPYAEQLVEFISIAPQWSSKAELGVYRPPVTEGSFSFSHTFLLPNGDRYCGDPEYIWWREVA